MCAKSRSQPLAASGNKPGDRTDANQISLFRMCDRPVLPSPAAVTKTGVLIVVQRFRNDLGLYVHLHALVMDGCFQAVGEGEVGGLVK
jgi:hypothetical protein